MASRRRQQTIRAALALGLACTFATAADSAVAANSLATPITGQLQQDLWPVDVAVEIVAVSSPEQTAEAAPVALLPPHTVTVPDGNRVSFSQAVWTPRGRRDFAVDVVARQHPRDQMEVEWDLVVEDAPYQTVTVGDYLLHRLRFGPRPQVADEQVRVSRADIVTTQGEPHVETVEIDGAKYEIRIFALSVRG